MNNSHISDEQVDLAMDAYCSHKPIWDYKNGMRRALEAAFPEPSIQELLSDEERSARHDDPQQPAAFGPLVITEEILDEAEVVYMEADTSEYRESMEATLQWFVNRHSIKPIAFADKTPEEGQEILYWSKCLKCWSGAWKFEGAIRDIEDTYWLPASALPIPEPAVDPMESAWREYCTIVYNPDEHDFKAGYEAGQAGGKQP